MCAYYMCVDVRACECVHTIEMATSDRDVCEVCVENACSEVLNRTEKNVCSQVLNIGLRTLLTQFYSFTRNNINQPQMST